MSNSKEKARARLLEALPYFRHAANNAKEGGKIQLGILSVKDGKSGQIVARFDADDFFDDLALILDAPPQTKNDDMRAAAEALLQSFGLK
jgi:hypothetical protein